MKKQFITLMLLTSLCFINAQAQITLSMSNVASQGEFTEQASDTSSELVTIGSGGENQVWDFSALSQDEVHTLFFSDPSTLTGNSNFSSSNLGMEDTRQDSAWFYLTKSSTGLVLDGSYQIEEGLSRVVSWVETLITFPSTMGSSHNDNWSGTIMGFDLSAMSFILGIDSIKTTSYTSTSSSVDGWGDVITPIGTFPALRQLVYQERADTTWERSASTGTWSVVSTSTIATLGGFGVTIAATAYDTTRTARWWTNDEIARFPLVEIDYEADGSATHIVWQKSPAPTTDIKEQDQTALNISLYPNPAIHTLTITISPKLNNEFTIEILDVSGRLISTTHGNDSKVVLPLIDFKNGLYLCHIKDIDGTLIHTNKFIVNSN